MTYHIEGILDIYSKELVRKNEVIDKMPPGDERAQRSTIVVEIRGLLAAADHAICEGRKADMTLDDIERLLSKI